MIVKMENKDCIHYGTCDVCKQRFVIIYHFNYGQKNDFRVCNNCIKEAFLFMRDD